MQHLKGIVALIFLLLQTTVRIITYITAEEIRNLGARNLMEVLRQVHHYYSTHYKWKSGGSDCSDIG
jgi:hypothetical protein